MEQNKLNLVKQEQAPPFEEVYDRYAERLYAFIYYKTCHRETAEDITSKVFLKALEKWDTYDPAKGAVNTWLYQIARNAVCDHYRKKKSTVDIEDVWDLADHNDHVEDTHLKMRMGEVEEMMKTLPADQRDILILRIWQDMPYKEIAEVMDKSEGACKMLFSRTISKLKRAFPAAMVLGLFLFKLTDNGGLL